MMAIFNSTVAKLALVLGIIVTVALVLLGARNAGRALERAERLAKNTEVQNAMLKAAARGPRDRDELAGRLRDGRF